MRVNGFPKNTTQWPGQSSNTLTIRPPSLTLSQWSYKSEIWLCIADVSINFTSQSRRDTFFNNKRCANLFSDIFIVCSNRSKGFKSALVKTTITTQLWRQGWHTLYLTRPTNLINEKDNNFHYWQIVTEPLWSTFSRENPPHLKRVKCTFCMGKNQIRLQGNYSTSGLLVFPYKYCILRHFCLFSKMEDFILNRKYPKSIWHKNTPCPLTVQARTRKFRQFCGMYKVDLKEAWEALWESN